MQWRGRRGSDNVESGGSGGGRFPGGGLALGGGATIIVVIISLLLGQNPLTVLNSISGSQETSLADQTANPSSPESLEGDTTAQFVSVVLADTEEVWDKIFADRGQQYQKPKLVLFRSQVQSACGGATAASGPFYCPGDRKVYIDLSFYDDLRTRFGAPGDFAMAYVIAHEVGHHVQYLEGTSEQVDKARGQVSDAEYNQLSVRLELQADFYAGVWANHAQKQFNSIAESDIQEALQAANAIGDDRLQKEAQGYTVPDAFTHGTSAQRMRWFSLGYKTGNVQQGNTFAQQNL
jgi:uncharacterized protein